MTLGGATSPEHASNERHAVVTALEALGAFVAGVTWERLPGSLQAATQRVWRDSLAVLVAGGRLAESARLRAALPTADGTATVLGDERQYGVTDAAWLNGTAMVALELDEGNKRIRGHATAHVLPAVLAVAEHRHATGQELAGAFVAGHEVASRFGAATLLRPGVHPHGNWGVAGAAAGAARLAGGSAADAARAMDAAGAMAMATPFSVATAGLGVRNAWIGAANVAGIQAAALATDGGPLLGVANESLGQLLGTLDPSALTRDLGEEYAMTGGYFKRHASCSYTHPPADAALALRSERGPFDAGRDAAIESISVTTHALAAPLGGMDWPTRLAAMFSIPYVVAVALREGDCTPGRFDERHRADPALRALAARVRVREDAALTARLPAQRVARLEVSWTDGSRWATEVENPVGDADHHPLSDDDLRSKATALLGDDELAAALWAVADDLFAADDVAVPLTRLRGLVARTPTGPPTATATAAGALTAPG